MATAKNKGGQPTKLTPAVQRTILNVIKRAGFYRDACVAAGITEQTFANWRERGAAGEAPYVGFFEALRKAEAERRLEYLRESERRGRKRNDPREVHWRAAVTDPEVFSIKHHVVVQQQFDSALERLREEFKDEPAIYERALRAIAGAADMAIEGDDAGLVPR